MNANQINAALRRAGLKVQIRRGKGYYYWLDLDGHLVLDAESVYVWSADQLTLEQWLDLARGVAAA